MRVVRNLRVGDVAMSLLIVLTMVYVESVTLTSGYLPGEIFGVVYLALGVLLLVRRVRQVAIRES